MNELSIYLDREDAGQVEGEERDAFIKAVLENIGIPLEEVWPEEQLENASQKVDFRLLMNKFGVDILDNGDRGLKVYVDDEVIAEWFKPRFVLRTDLKARRSSGRLYYEMIIKYWSVFDDEETHE